MSPKLIALPLACILFFVLLSCSAENPAATPAPPADTAQPNATSPASVLVDITDSPPAPATLASSRLPVPTLLSQTPSATSLPLREDSLLSLTKVVTGTIASINWVDRHTFVYYKPDSNTHWAVDLQSQTSDPVPYVEPEPPLLPLSGNPSSFRFSPDGSRLLYTIPLKLTPTPLPLVSPEAIGEVWVGGGPAELWLWSEQETTLLSIIEDCVEEYIWSLEGDTVVITTTPPPAECIESYGWLVDLNTKTVTNLFPRERHHQLYIRSLSPDGETALFSEERQLHTLNLRTMSVTELDAPPGWGQWLSNEEPLLLYIADPTIPQYAIAIYDLVTGAYRELLGPSTEPSMRGKYLGLQALSPDREWLVFSAGNNPYEMEGVWLLKLN